jgi:hypothetical protein
MLQHGEDYTVLEIYNVLPLLEQVDPNRPIGHRTNINADMLQATVYAYARNGM